MSLEFTTAKKRREPIKFSVDGEQYEYVPQKQAGMALALRDGNETEVMREMFDWLSDGLPEEQAQRLIDRLKDPADEMDIDDLGKLIGDLQDQIAGRPTTSRAGSSDSRTTNGQSSTAGRRRKASTSSTSATTGS